MSPRWPRLPSSSSTANLTGPQMSPLVLLLLAHLLATATAAGAARTRDDGPPAPSSSSPRVPATTPPWPDQFHAVVVTNLSARGGGLQLIDLYYDWPRGRDLNIVRDQLSGERRWSWNVEWSNGTAFLFDSASCRTFQFAVGLLPPDWKARGAAYLGRDRVDGFDCHVWSNFVFARYYEDVATGRPVSWNFNGLQRHVLSFEAGAVLQDSSKWQAPAYCFTNTNGSSADAAASSS
ncbi:uncharacterized protein [Zea mays]|uniref:Uncharacterized protein n=2 Tax=Zea mays TaxID=4577 RepID=A0A804Q7E2_MAIZE|nr:uncharacterized protein LOC100276382 isoform X2 [Zea mays]|eukprot:XP_008651206.1 uncharacterized protein LOC100276382 isoform X1 [Zea mays]